MSMNFNFSKVFASDVSDRLNKADDYLYLFGDPVASVESAGTALEQLVRHIIVKEGFAETDFSILKDGIDYLELNGFITNPVSNVLLLKPIISTLQRYQAVKVANRVVASAKQGKS